MASASNIYSIGAVAHRTGLTPALIRMWESRYEAVLPDRTESGQRRYSDDDVRRLEKLKLLVDAGHRIGLVAGLDDGELDEAVAEMQRPVAVRLLDSDAPRSLEPALAALSELNHEAFRDELDRAALRLGNTQMLEQYLTPLMHEIGERTGSGALRMVHEHLATAEVRGFLDGVTAAFPPAPSAPTLISGTPAWQHHELGSLIVGAVARSEGWRVTYVGPNLPASELAAAAIEVDATAVALSVTYVDDLERTEAEFELLSKLLPQSVALIVGGRGATAPLDRVLDRTGAVRCGSLDELRSELGRLRSARLAG